MTNFTLKPIGKMSHRKREVYKSVTKITGTILRIAISGFLK